MTKPSGPPETARGRKGWKQKSNAKPNNLAMNLSPSCPKPHDTASASGNTLKERDAGCICCCQWKRVVVPFAINSCCRNAPLDIREANELPQRAESSLEVSRISSFDDGSEFLTRSTRWFMLPTYQTCQALQAA